ncbi:dual specificity mitogen-activated protein kinase kinase 4-like isoform X3 [Gordionus sp. m RMFG-2023]|uniref:dual specificity mitogen-activated protein kinase kinase 4-like isoform X3 n=1 Tax=Gordionus sp. m RMFG-2023 TaxID=3053472 RepID=UPI0031FC8657
MSREIKNSSKILLKDIKQQERRKNLYIDFSYVSKNLPSLSPFGSSLSSKNKNPYATGKLTLSPELIFEFKTEDLKDLGEIGRGSYGAVNKMLHLKSGTKMAVKRIRSTINDKEQNQILMDLEVVMKSNECPYIVKFYGALFKEGDCWICMELMDTCLDKFYKHVYNSLNSHIPEDIIGKITFDTLLALNYLKERLKIIHRDIKPSNILLDQYGNVKLCDFGISGKLVDSIAKTRDAGCRPYMAPERIDPSCPKGYGVRSDVWSLGITLLEVCIGTFPYPKWNSVFEQLAQIVHGDAPKLSNSSRQTLAHTINYENIDTKGIDISSKHWFSEDLIDFVNSWFFDPKKLKSQLAASKLDGIGIPKT